MGTQLFDEYTILHFASGIIVYFWGVHWIHWILAHVLFEFIENSTFGMKFINETLTFWPGGKPRPDSFLNIVGDNIGAVLGWFFARFFDQLGKERKWYH